PAVLSSLSLHDALPIYPYVVEVAGTYDYGGGGPADAECASRDDDPTFKPSRYLQNNDDVLDLYMGDKPVRWLAAAPGANGCSTRSEEHTSELQSLAYLV